MRIEVPDVWGVYPPDQASVPPARGPSGDGHDSRPHPLNLFAMSASVISIELTSTQIDRVVRGSSGAGGVSGLLRGLDDTQATVARFKQLTESPRMSRSLLLGLLVLAAFPTDGTPLTVTDVATRLQMSPSTTHRYLTTLLAVGLLEQDSRTRRYHVPPSAR